MAGIRGRSGPPGNQNAFRHGLAGIAQRRADGVLNPQEQLIREEILSGLLADKGGAAQISTACKNEQRNSRCPRYQSRHSEVPYKKSVKENRSSGIVLKQPSTA
jgi:hypothetical protein